MYSRSPDPEAVRAVHEEISAQAKALPYLAGISSARALVIPERPFTAFPGLLAVHRVRHSGTGDTLITYWASEGHFAMNRAALTDRIGGQVAFEGGLGSLEAPNKPWWRRFTPLQILLAAAGAAGAFQVLHNQWQAFMAAPDLSITMDKAEEHQVLAGESFMAKATVENFLSSVDHRNLTIEAALRPTTGPNIPLTVPDSPLKSLGAGKTHGITIVGKAPPRGNYVLEVTVSGKSGYLTDPAPFRTQVPLRSWARNPEPMPLRMGSQVFPTLLAQVEVGRDAPAGITCSATLTPTKPIAGAMNWWLSNPQALHEEFGSEVMVVRWTWPRVSARSEPAVEWSFKGISANEMRELARGAEVNCIANEGTP